MEMLLIEKIKMYFQKYQISPYSKVLIAFSGGSDSLALLLLSLKYFQKSSIVLAYINHNLRDITEVEEELNLISFYSQKYQIKLYQKNIYNLKEEAYFQKKSIEEQARNYRYDFFNEIKKYYNYDYLLTAHHRDDNEETFVMRFFQGSFLYGLQGIHPFKNTILRPLIDIKKEEILNFTQNYSYIIDKSNFKDIYLRNKVRLNLLPEIKKTFPSYAKSIDQFIYFNQDLLKFLNQLKPKWKKEDQGYSLNLDEFINLPKILQYDLIYDLSKQNIPYRFFKNLDKNLEMNQKILLKGYNFLLEKKRNKIFYTSIVEKKVKIRYFIKVIDCKNIFILNYCIQIENNNFSNELILCDFNKVYYFFSNKRKKLKKFLLQFAKYSKDDLVLITHKMDIIKVLLLSEERILWKNHHYNKAINLKIRNGVN